MCLELYYIITLLYTQTLYLYSRYLEVHIDNKEEIKYDLLILLWKSKHFPATTVINP